MRTSLNEIKEIEQHLMGNTPSDVALVFEAKVLTQPALRMHVHLQQKISRLVKLFHRKRMKQDLDKMHDQIFTDPLKSKFRQQITQLFNS